MAVDPFVHLELDLLKAVAADKDLKNIAISGFSASTALGLAYAGAAGETRAEFVNKFVGKGWFSPFWCTHFPA